MLSYESGDSGAGLSEAESMSLWMFLKTGYNPEIEQWHWGNGAIPWEFGVPLYQHVCFVIQHATWEMNPAANINMGQAGQAGQVKIRTNLWGWMYLKR